MITKLKHFFLFSFPFLFLVLTAPFSYGEVTALGDILDSPQAFNGREVVIEGEVVGEPLKDARGIWINIVSGTKQIGVFSVEDVTGSITYWGSYRYTGDRVRIKGIFYKDCPIYQMSDVYLDSLEIIEKGHENKFLVTSQKKRLAIILSISCLTVAILYLIKLKYGKRT